MNLPGQEAFFASIPLILGKANHHFGSSETFKLVIHDLVISFVQDFFKRHPDGRMETSIFSYNKQGELFLTKDSIALIKDLKNLPLQS